MVKLYEGIIHYYGLEETSGDRADHAEVIFSKPNVVIPTALSEVTASAVSYAPDNFSTNGIRLIESAGSAVRNTTPPTQTADFSVSFWINEHANPTGSHVLVARDDNTAGNWFIISQTGHATRFLGGFGSWSLLASLSRTIDTWHHIVCTRKRSGEAHIYIDGSTRGSTSDSGAADLSDNTADLSIGGRESGSYAAGECPSATIDQVIIWNRALSADEVATLYNGGTGLTLGQLRPGTSEIADPWGNIDSDHLSRPLPSPALTGGDVGRPTDPVMDMLFPAQRARPKLGPVRKGNFRANPKTARRRK